MKKIIIYTLLGLLVVILVTVLVALSNPLRKSNEEIRERMLELTPIGTSMEDVIKVIEENEYWYKNYTHHKQQGEYTLYDDGYILINGNPLLYGPHLKDIEATDIIGKQTIEAIIGEYTKFFNVSVIAYWAFDEDGKLVDVVIHKGSDSI